MSDWRMAIQMAAAESAQRIAALEAENARLQGAIFAHHERYDQLKLWCDGEIEQHHMLTADVQRLQGELGQEKERVAHYEGLANTLYQERDKAEAELEQARLKHEQDQATISLLERNWYTCTEERDAARQQLAEAQDVLNDLSACLCGCPINDHENYGEDGESCENETHFCTRVFPSVALTVNHERDQAQAEVVRLQEALKQALDEYEAYLEETKEMARRHPELLHEPHDDDWAVLLRLRALLAATSPAVASSSLEMTHSVLRKHMQQILNLCNSPDGTINNIRTWAEKALEYQPTVASVEQRLKAADSLLESANSVINDAQENRGTLSSGRLYFLEKAVDAYRAASGEE